MIKHIFFDFNGTIIDDLDLCLELLNKILISQNKPTKNIDEYKHIFTFPIIDYYKRAGVDFEIESFDSLSLKFIKEYQPRSLECGLFKGSYELFEYLNNKGINLYILSASKKENLIEQCKSYKIDKYFKDILGISDIKASGKIDIALNYINNNDINKEEVLFIGDTLHDYEVAKAMEVKCMLVSCGHQAVDVLKKANVKILDSICDLYKEL